MRRGQINILWNGTIIGMCEVWIDMRWRRGNINTIPPCSELFSNCKSRRTARTGSTHTNGSEVICQISTIHPNNLNCGIDAYLVQKNNERIFHLFWAVKGGAYHCKNLQVGILPPDGAPRNDVAQKKTQSPVIHYPVNINCRSNRHDVSCLWEACPFQYAYSPLHVSKPLKGVDEFVSITSMKISVLKGSGFLRHSYGIALPNSSTPIRHPTHQYNVRTHWSKSGMGYC